MFLSSPDNEYVLQLCKSCAELVMVEAPKERTDIPLTSRNLELHWDQLNMQERDRIKIRCGLNTQFRGTDLEYVEFLLLHCANLQMTVYPRFWLWRKKIHKKK